LTRTQAAEFLHNKGYSRRISAKLADIAFITKGNTVFEQAVKDALEKARAKGAKDIKPRKKKSPWKVIEVRGKKFFIKQKDDSG
jgi:hypothetical protein